MVIQTIHEYRTFSHSHRSANRNSLLNAWPHTVLGSLYTWPRGAAMIVIRKDHLARPRHEHENNSRCDGLALEGLLYHIAVKDHSDGSEWSEHKAMPTDVLDGIRNWKEERTRTRVTTLLPLHGLWDPELPLPQRQQVREVDYWGIPKGYSHEWTDKDQNKLIRGMIMDSYTLLRALQECSHYPDYRKTEHERRDSRQMRLETV